MKARKIGSGSDVFDELLDGGYEPGIITTIFGPAGSGKTTICIMASIKMANEGKKTFFLDTEGGFSIDRFMQLSKGDKELLKNILILKPINFNEQIKNVEKIKKVFNDKIGLVVVDTISMLYRVQVGETKNVKKVNNELSLQIAWLTEIAREHNVPVLITNQVYADFDKREKVKMVGGDMLRYNSKCLIELENLKNTRRASIRKHRSLPEDKEIVFRISEEGFEKVK